jgi:hypothetical protein
MKEDPDPEGQKYVILIYRVTCVCTGTYCYVLLNTSTFYFLTSV